MIQATYDRPAMQHQSASTPSTTSTTTGPWTTRRLLGWMTPYFEKEGIEPARIISELLLVHVLQCERTRLYMEADRPATEPELTRLRELVRRAAEHEPVHYLVGRAPFFVLDFEVEDCTLIPQPSTETLVAHVLEWIRADSARSNARILDIGTGCGAIAVSLARHAPEATLVATDIIPAAIDLATRNAEHLGAADRVEFRHGSLFDPLASHERFDVICSNPPYIPDHEWDQEVEQGVKQFVPSTALRGGPDGMEYIRPIVCGAAAHLNAGGLLAVEIASSQKDDVIKLAEATGDLTDVSVLKDGDGLWRVLVAHRID